ncbi:MAG: UpxY family transcription antiterminator [Deltaproteobacteria bacterium]|nr:UpxY family transcription antiterminator [Deltaproteobacteria bacterium]
MNHNASNWYALHTRSHFEQKVYDGLCRKSIEAFLPRIEIMSRRRDRRKMILIPMLPGYVFAFSDLSPEKHLEILKTAGVVRMVGFKGKPVPAREEEISSLMILDGTNRTVQSRDYMKKGDRVMIMEGPLKGLVGFYLRHKGQSDHVVVSVELLQRSLSIEIEDWALEKVP